MYAYYTSKIKRWGGIVVAFVSIFLLAIAVSIDGFWGGFAYGLRKVKIPFLSLGIISFWSVICTMITMLLGKSLVTYLSINNAKLIGAILLIGIGIYALKEGLEQKNKITNSKLIHNQDIEKTLDEEYESVLNKDNIQLAFREQEAVSNTNLSPIVLLLKVLRDPLEADIDKSGTISIVEGTILGLALAMDACVAAFALSIAGLNPFLTPLLFGFTHFVLIGLGNIIASYDTINKIGGKIAIVPGGILIIIGLLRFL